MTLIDPLDVAALEKSVNDSAASVSTIWASYILFGLYLLLTAGSVTHRQLLLEDPVRLPVLNIDLPMVGFFLVAPTLFVALHCYVLMQAVVLARTAAIYNQAVDSTIHIKADRTRLRLRLANNLFAQIFAGALRKGEGLAGWPFRQIAWTTLAIAPLAVLVTFEYKFLPYHSLQVTWTHRILALIDLVLIALFWIGMLVADESSTGAAPISRSRKFWISVVSCAIATPVLLVFFALLSFPGEPQAPWTRFLHEGVDPGKGLAECQTNNLIGSLVNENFDRLSLPNEPIVDGKTFAEADSKAAPPDRHLYLRPRSRIFRDRNFRCAIFDKADVRRADFAGADLTGASFVASKLEGASFDHAILFRADLTSSVADDTSFGIAHLRYAILARARLRESNFQGASLEHANAGLAQLQDADFSAAFLRDINFQRADMRGAIFKEAQLQGAYLGEAKLDGTDFRGASLEGADFILADARGSNLSATSAQAASFLLANLQGADLSGARLQGASFVRTYLQGANLSFARLQGTVFHQAQLQGANLTFAELDLAYMRQPFFWHTEVTSCENVAIVEPQLKSIVIVRFPPIGQGEQIEYTPDSIQAFVDDARHVMADNMLESFEARLRQRLIFDPINRSDEPWSACATKSALRDIGDFEKRLSVHLLDMLCSNQSEMRSYIARGLLRTWTSGFLSITRVATYISNALPDPDKISCPGPK